MNNPRSCPLSFLSSSSGMAQKLFSSSETIRTRSDQAQMRKNRYDNGKRNMLFSMV